jgi:hypothetical protein
MMMSKVLSIGTDRDDNGRNCSWTTLTVEDMTEAKAQPGGNREQDDLVSF